jgi:hypothetical protein
MCRGWLEDEARDDEGSVYIKTAEPNILTRSDMPSPLGIVTIHDKLAGQVRHITTPFSTHPPL